MCVGSMQYVGIETFRLLRDFEKHFELKIYKYFELYQVFMYNFLC